MADFWRIFMVVFMIATVDILAANIGDKENCIKEVGKLMVESEIDDEVWTYINEVRRLYSMPIDTGYYDRFESTEGCKRIMDQWKDYETKSYCEKGSRHGLMSETFMRGVIKESQNAKDMVEAWFVCTHGDETPWAMDELGILEDYKQTDVNGQNI